MYFQNTTLEYWNIINDINWNIILEYKLILCMPYTLGIYTRLGAFVVQI